MFCDAGRVVFLSRDLARKYPYGLLAQTLFNALLESYSRVETRSLDLPQLLNAHNHRPPSERLLERTGDIGFDALPHLLADTTQCVNESRAHARHSTG